MGFRVEPLSGGLVNARDAAMLAPGELSYIQNAVYVPGNQALIKARGRANYAIASATASYDVVGLRDVKFDSGLHVLVALASNTIFVTDTSLGTTTTNTFATSFAANATGANLENVHFNNSWYTFIGNAADLTSASATAAQNFVAYCSTTGASAGSHLLWRMHGMNPVQGMAAASATSGTFTASTSGVYYEYWATEVVEFSQDGVTRELESTFTGTPTKYYVSSTASAVRIGRPNTANPNATKWRVYRSPLLTTIAETSFPVGYKIGPDLPITASSTIDGVAAGGSYVFAAATSSSFGFSSYAVGNAGWANITAMNADDANYATASAPAWSQPNPYHAPSGPFPEAFTYLYNFTGLSTSTDPITGLEIAVDGRLSSGNGTLIVQPLRYDPTTGFMNFLDAAAVPLASADSTVILGGNGNVWGAGKGGRYGGALVASDFATAANVSAAKFAVGVSVKNPTISSSTTFLVDQVKVKLYSGGSSADTVAEESPFPAIVLNQAGVETSIGSHGKPPVANTADVFQGSLVTNNVSEPSNLYYSLPDQPDYFPSLYFIDFETPDNDRITNVKTLNNRLGVFLSSRLYRVNYLPTEVDADFNRGRCKEEVSAELGCINNMCACTFVGPSGRTELAFVSNVGIHRTDLFTVQDLTTDIDWRDMFPIGSTAIALINDPENGEILFYYSNSSGADSGSLTNETYQCLHLSYDGAHIKTGGKLKVSGPVFMRNYDSTASAYADLNSAWPVTIANGNTYIYLGYGGDSANSSAAGAGTVWRESSTDILPVNDPRMRFRTRRMFEAGWGKEWRLDASYLYLPDGYTSNDAQTLSITPITVRTNDSAATTEQTSVTATQDGHKLLKFQHLQEAEGMVLEVGQATGTTKNLGLQHIVLEGKNMGKEDSGI